MNNRDYEYYSLARIQEHVDKELEKFKAVSTKYPDAQAMSYKHMPGGGWIETSIYFSPSIVHDDVQLDFSGTWYNLNVQPYVALTTKYGSVYVYNDPQYFQPFYLKSPILSGKKKILQFGIISKNI